MSSITAAFATLVGGLCVKPGFLCIEVQVLFVEDSGPLTKRYLVERITVESCQVQVKNLFHF